MKIRAGFVSNSSSSSFCVYGDCIADNDLMKLAIYIEKTFSNRNDFKSKSMYIINVKPEDKDKEWARELVYETIGFLKLEYTRADGVNFLGRSYETLRSDENGQQFKDSVRELFNTIFGEGKYKPQYMCEVISDG
jgi:hypothetical protein